MKLGFTRRTFVVKFKIRNSLYSSDKNIINSIHNYTEWQNLVCYKFLYDFCQNMALTLSPSVLNSIDLLDEVDINIFALIT